MPPAPVSNHAPAPHAAAANELKELIRQTASSADLLMIWRAHDEELWAAEPTLYLALARRFMGNGDGLLAHEVLIEARERGVADPVLEHQYGLVLARIGATERAAHVALQLRQRLEHAPESSDRQMLLAEVAGLLARTEKDMGLRAPTAAERAYHLRRAYEEYREGFERTQQYYLAINAATLALLLDDVLTAEALAAIAGADALAELARGPSAWAEATVGEAALIVRDRDEAAARYTRAARLHSHRLDDLASMRRQARLILEHTGGDTSWLSAAFDAPAVVAFAASSKLPLPGRQREQAIARAIRARLEQSRVRFGFSSAAPGSEIIFLEQLAALGGELTVVLPCQRAEFVRDYVAPAGDRWVRRCEPFIEDRDIVIEASPSAAAGRTVFEYASLLLAGLAAMHSQFIDGELIALVHDDTQQSSVTRQWRSHGHNVELLQVG